MKRLLVLGLVALAAQASAQSSTRPTRAALQRVAERCGPALVIVEGPEGRGPGVVVGGRGEILTASSAGANAGDVLRETRVHQGTSGFAVESVLDDPRAGLRVLRAVGTLEATAQAVPLEPSDALTPGHWVIALVRKEGAWVGLPLQLRQGTDLASPGAVVPAALPRGTPLFDARGRLVATVVGQAPSKGNGKRGKRALAHPLGPLRRAIAGETPP